MAEKLITLGKKNSGAARQQAKAIFYVSTNSCPRLNASSYYGGNEI
jgi:ribosomal protein L17